MKKAKRVTKRQKKAMIKFLEELKSNQPQSEITVKSKPHKVSKLLSLTKWLEKKAKDKQEKAHHREEKRDAKAGHVHDHEHK